MPRANKGPRLEVNDRGLYEIRWTDNGRSKRRSTGTSHLQSAEKVLGNFLLLDERERLSEAAQADAAPLVMAVLGDHLSEWSPADGARPQDYWHERVLVDIVDRETQKYAFVKLLKHFGHLAVKDIMPSDVTAYIDRRSNRPAAEWCPAAKLAGPLGRPSVNHTISRELSVLNAAINHAVKQKRVPRADQPFIKMPGTSQPRDRWLTHEEAGRLLTAAMERVDLYGIHGTPEGHLPRVYRFIALALNTASRKRALLELRADQVDMATGIIRLNQAGRVQTNKRRPVVPISDSLRPILERALKEIGNKPYVLDHPGEIRTAFENAVKRAGLGRDVTPHVLRHTKATWMAQAGRSMFEIAGVLGDTVETVTRTYAHHHPDYLRGAINAGMPIGATA